MRSEKPINKARDSHLAFLDSFPALVWRSDKNAKCDYFNQAWLGFTGRSMKQEMDDGWTEGVHPEDAMADCLASFLKAFHSRRPFAIEYRLRRHDGEYRWILDQGRAFYDQDNQFAGYMGSCFDITGRKRMEARFRRLMDSNMQGMLFWNRSGKVTEANDAFLKIVGYTRKDLEAGRINWAAMTPPEYTHLNRRALEEITATGICAMFEKEFFRKDGSRVPIFIGAATFEDNPDEGVCFAIDRTEHKEAELALKNSHAQLRALSVRLQNAREQESERMAREIHDDLGQALTALNMDLLWIHQKLEAEKSPLLRSQLQRRLKAMATLLQSTVRSVQRISTELRPAMLDDLGLTATLEWQADEFEERTGIRCQWKPKPIAIKLNRDQAIGLFRVFQEILTNVARHARAHLISLKLVQNDGELILQVADDGRGFNQKKLLAHKSFGLLGMRERVEFIRGRLEIHSTPEKGTKIIVTIPVMKPDRRGESKAGGSHGKKS